MLKVRCLNWIVRLACFSLFFFFTSPTLHAQVSNPTLDSLKTSLAELQDTSRFRQLLKIADHYKEGDSARYYVQQGIALAQDLGNDRLLIDAYNQQGRIQERQSRYSDAVATYAQVRQLAEKNRWTYQMLDALIDEAHSLNMKGASQPSLTKWLRGLKIADSLDLTAYKADIQFGIGDYFRLHHNVAAAIRYLDEAAINYNKIGSAIDVCKVQFIKAATYKIVQDTAVKYKGIAIYEEMLVNECRDQLNEFRLSKLYGNLGSTYTFVAEYDKAEYYLLKSLEIKRKVGNVISLAYTLNEMASLHFKQRQFAESSRYANEAYQLALQGEDIYLTYDILESMAVAERALGDYESAYDHLRESFSMVDSIQNAQRIQAIAELELKYETTKKEQEIAKRDLELALQENRFRNILLLAALLFFVLASLFFWYRHRLRLKDMEAQRLQELDQLKSRYFTNISHELRTPLSLILDPLRQLQSGTQQPRQQQLIATATHNARRISSLIDQMLDLDKLEARKMSLKYRNADLNSALSGLVATFEHSATNKNIDLQLVSKGKPLLVWYDMDAVEKILSNLLSNALKFTPESGQIKVQLREQERWAEIIVQDSGIGISPEQLPNIFDRFYQADDSGTRAYEGTGIGLALAKELAELHGGQLSAQSELGAGSQFRLLLPLGKDHVKIESHSEQELVQPVRRLGDQLMVPPQVEPLPVEGKDDQPIVLLIEDQQELRHYIGAQLSAYFSVVEAANGQEGIDKALATVPDLIISDIMMPKLDGLEVCRQLKAQELTAHIPIILLSAKSQQEDKLEGLKQMADDYLVKPFDSQELKLRAQNLIEQRQQLRLRFTKNKGGLKPSDITVSSVDEVFLTNLLQAIEQHMSDEGFGVEQLSQAAGMSRSQLHRKLKALTGQSPSSFMRSIRLQRAYQLLEKEAGTASEIAFQVGFSNANYFFKSFKNQFGITPGQVLKGEKTAES
ncbi:MAG: ATP-binding protein [Bacteroidota bacterium]